jgi:hypothetical protein
MIAWTDTNTRTSNRTTTKWDGTLQRYTTQTGNLSNTLQHYKDKLKVFTTTLLMIIHSLTGMPKYDIDYKFLEDTYTWLWGADMLGHKDFLQQKYIERTMWKDITIKVHEGKTLKEAMEHIKADTMYWINKLWNQRTKGKGKGKGKYTKGSKGKSKYGKNTTYRTRPSYSWLRPSYTPYKGKGKGYGKTNKNNKGKGKGGKQKYGKGKGWGYKG